MMLSEIRAETRRFLDEAVAESWTDPVLNAFINTAYEMRRAQIIAIHRLDFVKTYRFTFPVSTDFLTFEQIAELNPPSTLGFDVQEWIQVEDLSGGATEEPIEIAYLPWMRRHEAQTPAGARRGYVRTDAGYCWSYKGREFWVVQQPAQAMPLQVHVIPPFTPLQADQSRPEFTLFNRILAVDAAIYAREATGDAMNSLGTIRAELERSLLKAYEQRNSQEPDFMRSRAEDFDMGLGAR